MKKKDVKMFIVLSVITVGIAVFALSGCGGKMTWTNPFGFKDANSMQSTVQSGQAIGQGLVSTGTVVGNTAMVGIGTIIGGVLAIVATLFGMKQQKKTT